MHGLLSSEPINSKILAWLGYLGISWSERASLLIFIVIINAFDNAETININLQTVTVAVIVDFIPNFQRSSSTMSSSDDAPMDGKPAADGELLPFSLRYEGSLV